jgi:hypothetical protein
MKGVFGILVAIVVQSAFRFEIYQNKKNLFLTSAHQNDSKT